MGFFDRFSKKKGGSNKTTPVKDAKSTASKDAKVEAGGKLVSTQEPAKEVTHGPLAKDDAGHSHRILVRPMFTEKSAMLEAQGKYSFMVATDANKIEVAAAIRDLYGVEPVSVRIVNSKGKFVRFGRTTGFEKNEKKAIVTLKKGESLTVVATT